MSMRDVLHAVRARWLTVATGIVLGLAVAAALLWSTTPLYSSKTRLFVAAAEAADPSGLYQGDLFSQQRVTSYAELLTGQQLAGRVIEDLGLKDTPAELTRKVTATPVPDTVIVEITVTDTSPQRARDIAASLGRQFTDYIFGLETPVSAGVPAVASTVKVTTVLPADLYPDPVSPEPARYLSLGAVLGLLTGGALALTRHRLDDTVDNTHDVQRLTGVPVTAHLFEDPDLGTKHIVTALDQRSRTAEAFRAIRTNLLFHHGDKAPRVIAVASSVPGEGKSTLAVNLAIVLAESGKRVLVVDADLRRPRVTGYLGLTRSGGLTDVLTGAAELDGVVQQWNKLRVLAAGPMPPDPSETLGSDRMRSLLEELRATYDHVLIDTPALLAVTDAAVVSALSDGCLLTTRFGDTRREQLAEAVATLSRIGTPVLGVVVNRVPPRTVLIRGLSGSYRHEPDRDRQTTAALPDHPNVDDAERPSHGEPGRFVPTARLADGGSQS